MPTNRKRKQRGRVAGQVEFSDLGIMEKIAFIKGWHPLVARRFRWQTWDEFFDDSDRLRDEILSDPTCAAVLEGEELFADRLRAELKHGQEYSLHRHAALLHAHIRGADDGHTHDYAPAGFPALEVA